MGKDSRAQHVYVWEERVGGIYRDVIDRKRLSCTARLRLGRKSGRYLSRCRRWVKTLVHSTFTSGKKEWAVFIEMSSMGRDSRAQHVSVWEERVGGIYRDVIDGKTLSCTASLRLGRKSGRYSSSYSRAQHVYVWEERVGGSFRDRWEETFVHTFTSGKKEWAVFVEMSSMGKDSRAQHVYVWEERVGGIYRDVVDGKRLSCTARLRLERESGRYFSRCRRWEETFVHSTFTSGKKEWAVFCRDVVDGKRLSCTASLRLGRKSGRYFSRCRRWEETFVHSTFTSGKKEWAVFVEMSSMGKDSRAQHVYTSGKKEWAVFVEMSSMGKDSRAQQVYVWEERVGGIFRDVVDGKRLSCTARLRLGRKSGRYLSRCRRWEKTLVHSTFTSGKKKAVFIEMSSMGKDSRALQVYVWEERVGGICQDVVDGSRAQHVYVWEERMGGIYRDVVDGKRLSCTARLRLGRKSGRYLSRCRRWEKTLAHSTFKYEKKEWAVFVEMSSMGKDSRAQHVHTSGKKEWASFIEMSSLGKDSRAQRVYVWEERVGGIYRDVVDGKRLSCTACLRLGRKSGRYLSRCRRWEKTLVHSTFTSRKKEWAVFIEMSSMGKDSRAQHVYVWEERVGGFFSRCRHGKRLLCTRRFCLGRKSGRYLSRCRRWEKTLVHSTFTSGKKEWAVFIEMSSMGKDSRAQHFYVKEERVGGIYRDVVDGKRLSCTARLRQGRKSRRYLSRCRRWEKTLVHCKFTSGKKEWAVFIEMSSVGKDSRAQHVSVWAVFIEMSSMGKDSRAQHVHTSGKKEWAVFIEMSSMGKDSRVQHVYVGEERVGGIHRDVVDGKRLSCTACLRLG